MIRSELRELHVHVFLQKGLWRAFDDAHRVVRISGATCRGIIKRSETWRSDHSIAVIQSHKSIVTVAPYFEFGAARGDYRIP